MDHRDDNLSIAHVTAWARVVRAATTVLQAVEADLKQAGLPPLSWYDLLLELHRAGPAGLRPVQLQREMLIPQYNLSRLLDRVERAGYVRRTPCDEDGRGQIAVIEPAGRTLLERMWAVYRTSLAREFGSHLTVEQAALLADLLKPGFAAKAGSTDTEQACG